MCRVRNFSLPTMAENLGSPGGAGSEPEKAITAPPESPAGKFQLGETLPVVPARIVRRILKGDFVDMAELSEENLEVELRRFLDGEDSKPLPAHKLSQVADLLGWVRAFCHYTVIVVRVHSSKAANRFHPWRRPSSGA